MIVLFWFLFFIPVLLPSSCRTQLKKFLGKSVKRAKHLAEEYGERAVNKVKSVRDEVFHSEQDEPSSSDDEGMPYTRPVKFKAAHGFKGPFDFDHIRVVQDLSGEHMVRRRREPDQMGRACEVRCLFSWWRWNNVSCAVQGAVWTMKFSHCGRLLATAGQDNVVRIWVLKNAYDYFNNMRIKYNTEGKNEHTHRCCAAWGSVCCERKIINCSVSRSNSASSQHFTVDYFTLLL